MEFHGGCSEREFHVENRLESVDDTIEIKRAIVNKVIVRYLM